MTWAETTGPLRQGDICVVPAFPIWDLDRLRRSVGPKEVTDGYIMPLHRVLEWDALTGSVAVAICSHDCDVENPRGRTGIIVAPLVKIPAKPGEERHARILASGETTDELNYINLFPVVHSQGDTSVEAVIDFSAITSISKAEKAIPMLEKSRVLGCDDATREAIGRKLAMFFGRPPQAPRAE